MSLSCFRRAIRLVLAAFLIAFPVFAHAQVPPVAWRAMIYSSADTDAKPGSGDLDFGRRSLAIDAMGNVLVTGSSFNGNDYDYLTVKHDASGTVLWRAIARGSANKDDFALAIAVDAGGNSYVTGQSTNAAGYDNIDYLTVKYDVNGVEQWRAVMDGAGSHSDFARAIQVDAAGNVFVAGSSRDANLKSAYLTVKYNSDGIEQWRRTAIRSVDSFNDVIGLAMDTAGNVIVTGFAQDASGRGYFTVKYNTDGVEQWRVATAGSGSDTPYSIVADADGNVFVTGASANLAGNVDYLTIKLSSTGTELWRAAMNGAANGYDAAIAVGVDSGGNVVVTGSSFDGTRNVTCTVKYNSTGTEQWRGTISLPPTDYSAPVAMALDTDDNIYVASNQTSPDNGFFLTIKYSPAGVEQWRNSVSGPLQPLHLAHSLGVDTSGNVYVTGQSPRIGVNSDFSTVKILASGVQQWRVGEGPRDGLVTTLATKSAIRSDAAGNVYVSGRVNATYDIITVKYDASGIEQWRAIGTSDGITVDLGLDASGNVFVLATTGKVSGTTDFLLIKYSGAGVEQWRVALNGLDNGFDHAAALVVSANGNAYITGSVYTTAGSDFLTIKYDASGNEQWRRAIAGQNGTGPESLAMDSSENIAVCGRLTQGVTSQILTVKYNSAGDELWRKMNGVGNIDYFFAQAMDSAGNVYLTGAVPQPDYTTITFVVKYDSDGTEVWRTTLPAITPVAIAIDAARNVFIAGASSSGIAVDYVTIKLNRDGGEQWRAMSNASGNDREYAYALAVDAVGSTYITGRSSHSTLVGDTQLTIKYDAAGAELWRIQDGTRFESTASYAVLPDTSGNLFIAGNLDAAGAAPSMAITKRLAASAPLALLAAQSRKKHLGAPSFDRPLSIGAPISGTVSVEPRTVFGGFDIIFIFNAPVTALGSITAVDAGGMPVILGAPVLAGNEIRVNLPQAPVGGRITVSATGVNGSVNSSVSLGFLLGDVNSTHAVTAADISGVKARLAAPVGAIGAAFDLNADGVVDDKDVAIVKSRSGLVLP